MSDTMNTTPELQREIDDLYAVQLDNVIRQYTPAVRGLDDVTVGFRTGEITSLLGLSGSGKSTLLRHVNGTEVPDAGGLRVLGSGLADLDRKGLRTLRRDVGVISQHFNLIGPMSVLENVCTGRLGSLRGPRISLMMYPRRIRREALANLERVGLADRAFQRADTLSGGQQQRVAIARALMQKPRIMLADEPVASLDPVSAESVMTLLRQICVEDDLTVLCSLHQVRLAIDFSDRIIGLRAGRIVLDRPSRGLQTAEAEDIYSTVSPATARQEVPR